MINVSARRAAKWVVDGKFREWSRALRELRAAPRHTAGTVTLFGRELHYADGFSVAYTLEEIFLQQVYQFPSESESPRILDVGANIGLSAIYFKRLFPKCRLTAFEADPRVFGVFHKNMASFGLTDVEAIQRAVWDREGEVEFHCEGGDSGRLHAMEGGNGSVKVKTVRLKEYLAEGGADMVKIDIEGAELDVLRDCAEELRKVKNLFVEYHSFKGSPQRLGEVFSIIEGAGFRIYCQRTIVSPSPFMERHINLQMDLQMSIFGYRE